MTTKATSVAQRWRLDETYIEAVDEIVAAAYPESLLHVAPPGEANRQKAVQWFLREGLGNGAAGNKAATYLLIGTRDPNEAPARGGSPRGKGEESARRQPPARRAPAASAGGPNDKGTAGAKARRSLSTPSIQRAEAIPLNINVQIHISADAGAEQIE